ncbi:hypothetical protein PG987_007720 [Apiospora arundinis]
MKRFSQRVLSRGKSDSKSSKKNKDSKDGTASPSGSSRETQSPVLTPTSSTSTLNDIRNKPLPPNNTTADHGSPGPQAAGQGNGGDRFNSGPSPNGAGTPNRQGSLPPTVVISPSAPHVPPAGRR